MELPAPIVEQAFAATQSRYLHFSATREANPASADWFLLTFSVIERERVGRGLATTDLEQQATTVLGGMPLDQIAATIRDYCEQYQCVATVEAESLVGERLIEALHRSAPSDGA